jgi:enoyl-CoA hydratase
MSQMMIDQKIDRGIAVVSVKHGKANALDVELCQALVKCFDGLRSSDARAIVLTGQGQMFSAGVDLIRIGAAGAAYVRDFVPWIDRLCEAVFHHPKPVVAAINGHAIAGGAVLACCADRRIMARGKGRIGVTELLVGVPFPALAFEVLRFALPARHLPEFTYGGATYDCDAAFERGWVDEVVEAEALMPRAMAAAEQYAQLSPAAFAETKKQLRLPVIERMEKSGAAINETAVKIWTAPETLRFIGDYVGRTLKKA